MKHAVITGGGSGIGQALAWHLAEKGLMVSIIGRHQETLEETKQKYSQKITSIVADISERSGREHVFEKLKQQKIDYLIHNAATEASLKPIMDVTLDEWHYAMSVNVDAILFLTQGLLKNFNPMARILMISSGLAQHALAGAGTYCVSKAAVHMLYLCFKEELTKKQIYTSVVRPGIIDTPMQQRLRSADKKIFPKAEMFQNFKEQEKLVSPSEVADFITHFLLETDEKTYTETYWDFYERA